MPKAKRPGAADASDATLWARHAGPRVKAGTMAVPRRSVGRPHRGQRQRRERVGAVGLGRPHVRVAEVDELAEPLALLVQRHLVERDGHAVAGHEVTSPSTRGSMADWLAVAMSVPSSAQR